jgi:hypothetical protein
MSNGASLEPQDISIDFAVFPCTLCQGLFNQKLKVYRMFVISQTILNKKEIQLLEINPKS